MVEVVADVVKNRLQSLKALAICSGHLADTVHKHGVKCGKVATKFSSFPSFTDSVQPIFRGSSTHSC